MKKWPLKRRREEGIPRSTLYEADEDQEVSIEGEVIRVVEGKVLSARIRAEDSSTVDVVIFHPTDLHRRYLVRGAEIRLTGRPLRRHGRPCFVHPRIVLRPSRQRF